MKIVSFARERSSFMTAVRRSLIGTLMILLSAVPLFADPVTDWNSLTLQYIMSNGISNHFGNRALAMVHVAMFDAVNGLERQYEPFLLSGTRGGPPRTSGRSASSDLSASAAAFTVLCNLYPGDTTLFEELYREHLESHELDGPRVAAIRYGEQAGQAVLEWRMNDGSEEAGSVPFPDGTLPGEWRRTNPMMPPMLPGWGAVKPFGMRSGDQFRLVGPPDLSSYEYARDYDEVSAIGAVDSTVRTPEQTDIARFWPTGIPHIWNLVAQSVCREKGYSLLENSRLFALLNLALADGNIVGWDMKYFYAFWRPVTAITLGEYDGNDGTAGDPSWRSLIMAPPFPEYVSGHSTSCAAAAKVLAEVTGSDSFTFTVTSVADPTLAPRTFDSFWAAAMDAGISRIYGGIHFNFSNVEGLEAGRSLGRYLCEEHMRPRTDISPGSSALSGTIHTWR